MIFFQSLSCFHIGCKNHEYLFLLIAAEEINAAGIMHSYITHREKHISLPELVISAANQMTFVYVSIAHEKDIVSSGFKSDVMLDEALNSV